MFTKCAAIFWTCFFYKWPIVSNFVQKKIIVCRGTFSKSTVCCVWQKFKNHWSIRILKSKTLKRSSFQDMNIRTNMYTNNMNNHNYMWNITHDSTICLGTLDRYIHLQIFYHVLLKKCNYFSNHLEYTN